MSPATEKSLWRALEACRRYAEIDERVKDIGHALGGVSCLNYSHDHHVMPEGIESNYMAPCIDRLFDYRRRYGWVYPREDEPELCELCQRKYNLIQERKQLRQRLGAAKREIIRVGRGGLCKE